MKTTLIVFTLLTFHIGLFSQSVDSLTAKISNQICDCIGDIEKYSDLKPRFDPCYDEAMNNVFVTATPDDIKILGNTDMLKKINSDIIPYLNTHCEQIKELISNELDNSVDESSKSGTKAFPTNFTEKDINKINKWNEKIIAFDGEIIRVETSRRNTPYYEMRLGGKSIWIISMVDSGFEKKGNKARVVGYLIPIDKSDNKHERQFHNQDYHVLVMGIVDLKTEKLSYFPGSEMQMKQWINGQIPSSGK
jgi:hypothetical protein